MTLVRRLFEIKTRGDLERLRLVLLGVFLILVLFAATFTNSEDFADPMIPGPESAIDTAPELRITLKQE